AYRLLRELGDEVGEQFAEAGLANERSSPLAARNGSILAHGFQPVGANVYRELRARLNKVMEFKNESDHTWSLPSIR
ncbi:MAG: hypothetical protein P1S59_14320, partial [bacterium]|nr:hypothetical protein [bacterium]